MRMRRVVWGGLLFLVIASLGLAATNAEMYFSSDKNGQTRVTNVQEGTSVWIVIHDPDENIDCDVRDKFWTDVKIMDPKTGAYIVWVSLSELYADITGHAASAAGAKSGTTIAGPLEGTAYKGHYPGNPGSLRGDYLEETGADTGLFVSKRAFMIGTREDFDEPYKNSHVVDTRGMSSVGSTAVQDQDGVTPKPAALASGFPSFQWGGYDFGPELPTKDIPNAIGFVRGWIGGHETDSFDIAFIRGLLFPGLTATLPFLPSEIVGGPVEYVSLPAPWLIGRFENMDTLVGMYEDPNDDTDVAVAMMKIIDAKAAIAWDQEVYKDANGSATITVTDPDENLDCNRIEYVPVFLFVNPGSWNAVDSGDSADETTGPSPNNFCQLKRTGGIGLAAPASPLDAVTPDPETPIHWYNIYNATKNAYGENGAKDGRYYIQYPTHAVHDHIGWENVTYFDTVAASGVTAVSFYAQETGSNTGVFQLNLNSILDDLGFNSLGVRDVLVAYYLDPNDEDDFRLTTAYIEEKQHSITSFTDATRQDKKLFWIGRDPVYVQVIDANANVDPCCPEQIVVNICDPHELDDGEWWILDETSSNSPVFFSNVGMELRPVWDALGVGKLNAAGGYQLELDNWRLEAFNEDSIYVRYNDVYYTNNLVGLLGLGDSDTTTAFSGPRIDRARVANDVSFAMMEIGDMQVYNGQTVNMYFLDRQGNRVQGYVNSDCVFIEVVDPDQNEDTLRRERVDAFWDGGQNIPFGPKPLNVFGCDYVRELGHPINPLLGDTNIFNNSPIPFPTYNVCLGEANIYVLNPRNGRWAGLDLLETGIGTGDFMSVVCVDLASQYGDCVPTLGALPGDTIVAFYQDPSNHSDSAMIQVKVGIGGGTTPASQESATAFTNAAGAAVQNYTDADLVYARVVDPSHAGAAVLRNAVTILGVSYDLLPIGGAGCRDDNMPPLPPVVGDDVFITVGLDLNLAAGASITATYKDPNDPNDTSSDTITVIASKLDVVSFYAGPSPAAGDVTFGYKGSGMASVMSVEVYDLAGHCVWASELANVTQIVWSPAAGDRPAANGCYIYLVTATDGTQTFRGKGTVFISR